MSGRGGRLTHHAERLDFALQGLQLVDQIGHGHGASFLRRTRCGLPAAKRLSPGRVAVATPRTRRRRLIWRIPEGGRAFLEFCQHLDWTAPFLPPTAPT